jgi:hypothetical protein
LASAGVAGIGATSNAATEFTHFHCLDDSLVHQTTEATAYADMIHEPEVE